jgi:hypothetical protein
MSLLVRAALLGGLAYVVSRAVRNSQYSLDSSRSETQRLARTPGSGEENLMPSSDQRSAMATSAPV